MKIGPSGFCMAVSKWVHGAQTRKAHGFNLIRVPMLGYHTVLHAEHVEPEGLVMLAVAAGPTLAHVNDNHVVVADHVQQFALVVRWEFLCKTLAERVHETLQPGRYLRIVLNVVCKNRGAASTLRPINTVV
jgi:hypothetical protein